MTPDLLRHGRRLTVAQRVACLQYAGAARSGAPVPSVSAFARHLGCHRDTVYYWMARPSPLSEAPGPAPGTVRRPLPDAVRDDLATWRQLGLSRADVAAALQTDWPEHDITHHQVATLARHEAWPSKRQRRGRRPVQPFTSAPVGFLHVDLVVGPRPGRDPVLLVSRERHSRWLDMVPLPSKASAIVAEGLTRLLARCPVRIQVVLTDRGSEFQGAVTALLAARGIEHRRTRPYTPQTNGLVERANGLLKQYGPLADPTWWDTRPGEYETDADRWHDAPPPDRRLPRFERELTRWCQWQNLVRPNRQLGRLTPWAWCQAHPDHGVGSVQEAILEAVTHRPGVLVTHGLRYAHAPPPWWHPPTVGLSGDP